MRFVTSKGCRLSAFAGAVLGLAVFLCLALILPRSAAADELDVVFGQLLAEPANPSLNLRYAELAIARGETRKALAAYERVLAQDPTNRQVIRAYNRAKRRLQPTVTAFTLSTGFIYESNPRQVTGGSRFNESDVAFEATLLMFDERTISGHRWRTVGNAGGHLQFEVGDLNDAYVSLITGPVIDLGTKTRLHIAPGTAGAWLDDDWVYYDGLIKFTLERVAMGATQDVTVAVKHRETNSDFGGSDGLIVEVNGNFVRPNVIKPGDSLYVLPHFRYSKPGGNGPGRVFQNSLFPGDYIEYGGRLVYYKPVAKRRIYLGGGIGVFERDYNQNVAFGTKDREDTLIVPTAHVILPNVRRSKFDLRFDYRFEHNDSNDPTEDFENHVVGGRTVRRF
ncbi:MAG: tetratricopeptide repeat protein [Hyphomicrobiaceae bacterium]|nr:tetratricopeptide repeat protein [Hyphomicrobiaceae bacterium]